MGDTREVETILRRQQREKVKQMNFFFVIGHNLLISELKYLQNFVIPFKITKPSVRLTYVKED